MKRREFLIGSAMAMASGSARGQRADPAKLSRIGVMSLCFDPVLKSAARPSDPKQTVDILDFADMVADRYGIHWLEFQHTDFDSTEPRFLQEFRGRVKKAKSRINQINLEFANRHISTPDPVLRMETIDLVKRWIDHAVALDCPRVMLNQDTLAPKVRQSAIETLKTINAYASSRKVSVTFENRWATWRGAPNVPWDILVEVIKASGSYANPDCGNFPDKASRDAALPVMYRLTSGGSHVKHFPEKFDTTEAIRMSKDAGYKGLFTIEERGFNSPDPYVGVQTVVDLLLANI